MKVMKNARKMLKDVAVEEAFASPEPPSSYRVVDDNAYTEEKPQGPTLLEENEIDTVVLRSFLRDYLPSPKAPEPLKAWIREIPYREPKKK